MLKTALFDCAINEKCCSVNGFDSSRVPTPGNLPSEAKKKMLMPGIQPGGIIDVLL